ncbi:rhodanese-like domain-containing protein 6 isoform X2 [Malania oleifera]|uniref:rhodanese-like domain-containing protein 6 isoform X2 n=1 Tax=Malania oleifera TaxID=397392 RepID=UPI0025AE55EE|nr:rhodanese-like domain-containing protein 6 isoform X2 [Malania oleifera]
MASVEERDGEEEQHYGILLYYKYAHVPDLGDLFSFYDSNCNSLRLLGRVRLSPHGVNVTVGGKLSSLEKHIEAVKLNSLFEGTDFKLASCHHPLNDKVAKECGFTSLCIRVVKELVTFSSHPLLKSPEISNAGRHLSATEFHSVLQSAGDIEKASQRLILLDARNLYETRIGKFHTPCVETLDPGIRQYSDLPSWIDDNSERLRGSHVLMYCTGGIRCETASAYIRSKGAGFENVFQLYGGIQRYLEQFPDGGFFRGKNFVFDHRMSVGSTDACVMGACLLCASPFDDYSSRCRCTYCRMLVLVCDGCQKKGFLYVCELCQKHYEGSVISIDYNNTIVSADNGENKTMSVAMELEAVSMSDCIARAPEFLLQHGTDPSRKLRILCLHGFRQNASSFRGRTASLAKKLKNIAELIFIDAPHELPFIYQSGPTELHGNCRLSLLQQSPPPLQNCRRKFAWFVEPNFKGISGNDWKMACNPFDPLQYEQQTDGFDESLKYLKTVFSQIGPFDGVLGFSQGAAMAALLCAREGRLAYETRVRFVILCSGFALNLAQFERGSIKCPSLHIFGNDIGKDRQISSEASRNLASFFEDGCSVIMEHDAGHIIPTRSPYIDEIKDFLRRFT